MKIGSIIRDMSKNFSFAKTPWFTETQLVANVALVVTTMDQAVKGICELAVSSSSGDHIHLVNAYSIALADKSDAYRSTLVYPSINLPDGKPVSWASIILGQKPHLSLVRGPHVFRAVLDSGRSYGLRHYFLGSTPEVLLKLENELTRELPDLRIVGSHSPPFRPLSEKELLRQDDEIRASGADVVWVGLGTPKQDFEVKRLASSLPILAIAVGAAFEFAAGTKREAPEWVSEIGMEWAFRLLAEPRRLWRRYLLGNVRFLWSILKGRKQL